MDFISEGVRFPLANRLPLFQMSIAEMVANAAQEVFHSKVPQGFEWIAEYGQYYSKTTGYFYDPVSVSCCLIKQISEYRTFFSQ